MDYELKQLKKDYSAVEKKYKLPSFKDLNENFEIEKINKESETLLKLIRKVMMEKVLNSLGFIEVLFNPANAPRVYFPYLRSMTPEDKNKLEVLYDKFSSLSLVAMANEVEYSEKEEAELIKKISKTWKDSKSDFNLIIHNMQNPKKVSSDSKSKSYFG